jgi:putative DNA methylase
MGKEIYPESLPRGWHSRGYLPHFDGGEVAQSATFRLFDSLLQAMTEKWKQELMREKAADIDSQLRRRIEAYLDMGYGDCYLREDRVARIVQNSLLHFDGVRYKLTAWVVMPNHVHLLLTPQAGFEFSGILHSLKSFTSHEANKLIGRKGQLWQTESFDRFIRDDRHYVNVIAYIENNPVKARLCQMPEDWPYSSARLRKIK